MHSSAKNRGPPGESRDERLTHIGSGGCVCVHGPELLPTHIDPTAPQKNSKQRQQQLYSRMDSCTYLVPPSPVRLIVLSVRMVFEL